MDHNGGPTHGYGGPEGGRAWWQECFRRIESIHYHRARRFWVIEYFSSLIGPWQKFPDGQSESESDSAAPEIAWNVSLKITVLFWFNSAFKCFFLHAPSHSLPVSSAVVAVYAYCIWFNFLHFFSLYTYCMYSILYSVQNMFSCTDFLAEFLLFQAQIS